MLSGTDTDLIAVAKMSQGGPAASLLFVQGNVLEFL